MNLTSCLSVRWGVLDYAGMYELSMRYCGGSSLSKMLSGGGPVEIGSGVGGLAYAFVLGRRKEDQLVNFRYAFLKNCLTGCF